MWMIAWQGSATWKTSSGGPAATASVIATKAGIDEYKDAEPPVEVFGAHIEHEFGLPHPHRRR
jgi:hypothetical protein